MNTSNPSNTQHGNGGSSSRAGAADPSNQSADGLKQDASRLAEDAARQGKAQADHYRDVAADKVEEVADRIKAAAGELDHGEGNALSSHITSLADSMGKLSSDLREKSGDELLRDVNRLARQNPGMFVAGGIAVGFGLARLMKASASTPGQYQGGHDERSSALNQRDPGAGGYRPGAPVGMQDGWDQGVGARQDGSSAAGSGYRQQSPGGAGAASGSASDTLSTPGPASARDAQPHGTGDHRSKMQ